MTDRGVKHSTQAVIMHDMFRALDQIISEHETGRAMMLNDTYRKARSAWLEGGGRVQLAMEGKQ